MFGKDLNKVEPSEKVDLCPDSGEGVGHSDDAIAVGQHKTERKLEQVNEQIETLRLAMRSAIADAERARQRAEADLAHAYKFGIEGFAKILLPFKDALEMALMVKTDDVHALRAGVELSLKQLQAALEKHGLREISPEAGEWLDRQRHSPLVKLGADDGMRTIARTEQKGYEINGRVIRPACVVLQ